MEAKINRPELLHGETYKLKFDHMPNAVYVTINDVSLNGKLRPLEIFINTMNPSLAEPMNTMTRLLSAILRQGGSIEFAFEELSEMFSAEPFWYKGKQYFSIASVIGELLKLHCEKIGYKDER